MFSSTRKEEHDRKLAQEMEDARYIRDLLASTDGKKLWAILQSMLSAGELITLSDMHQARKKTPIYDSSNNITGYRDESFDIQDFYKHTGLIEGLRWLPEQINTLIRKAEREDNRNAKED